MLIIGDLNSYAKEDPIATLKAAGYRDMIDAAGSKNPYSYVFDGQWGYLDHALASKSLRSQITGAEDVHINADEPRCLTTTSTSRAPGRWPRCTPRIASGPATTTRYWWASRPLADASGAGYLRAHRRPGGTPALLISGTVRHLDRRYPDSVAGVRGT